MLVVLDTNVIISGLYSRAGASSYLLEAAVSGKLPFALSSLVELEYQGKIDQKIRESFLTIPKSYADKVLDALCSRATIIWRPVHIRPILLDSSDDKILECAVSGECSHLITFNQRHFPTAVTATYGIKVMTPGELLKVWRPKP